MMKRDTRVLFFTKDMAPTDAERELAFRISHNIGFRVADYAETGALETGIIGVAGEAPARYRAVYPYLDSKASAERLDKAIADGEQVLFLDPNTAPASINDPQTYQGPAGGGIIGLDDGAPPPADPAFVGSGKLAPWN